VRPHPAVFSRGVKPEVLVGIDLDDGHGHSESFLSSFQFLHTLPEGVKNSKPAEIGRARLPPSLMGRWLARRLALLPFFSHLRSRGGK